MSTSSEAIFTNRLYLTGLDSEEKRGYLHFQKGDTPVFTETGELTQKNITTIRSLSTRATWAASTARNHLAQG